MNDYFNDFQPNESQKSKRALPAWLWIIAVVGLVVSIAWGYSFGLTYSSMFDLAGVADNTPDSFDLGTLDFTDPIYIFSQTDRNFGYNLRDYPSLSLIYDTTRTMNSNGAYENEFVSKASFSSTFINMSYYDVSCVFSTGCEGAARVSMTFESSVIQGNLEARLVVLSKDYQTEKTEEGWVKIRSEYINTLYEFKANETVSTSFDYSGDGYLVLIVACESAGGTYSFDISAQPQA